MRKLNFIHALTFLCALLFFSCSGDKMDWQEGDILFQDGDCGDFCDAIRKVTQGYEDLDFSHNGLLMKEKGEWFVLEAVSKGVSKTALKEFMGRQLDGNGNPKVVVGRLVPEFQPLIPAALIEAQALLGKPYDVVFDLENDTYYCSELIHFAFKKANGGKNVFTPKPMTFVDPDTGELFGIWNTYYAKMGISAPEGEMGLNPGGMSLEPVLEIIYAFY
ncbi:YiiX/YebB-like N1pC/P60 family cysteine hydrolase [Rhodonellum sp.]|uniref:YiiX/YebB-like N1pC/P60 family cysteine hydrolase n=1 Tax=Rhodonellum sp. TaxID=2231180 RepID=UPI00271C5E1F|nr:YiiX/YebB-like N1pC/P60 family cysteine hydrolase [Rhodonellum sp.]MDO9552123.1 YiiX/YebB-like N1pC/P60 family cysteine hydrolase [Rhodonellum sp.]